MSFVFAMLLLTSTFLLGMEPGKVSPKSSPEGHKLREIVTRYLTDIESRQAAAEPVKDTAYYKQEMHSKFRHSVITPEPFIQEQVMAGPLCVEDNIGILCAAHIIFMVNLIQGKVTKTINLPGKLEQTDTHRPTPCSVAYARIAGVPEKQIIVGEIDGRVLIADPASYAVKTFGQVAGKALGLFIDPQGEKIAVRYESKDEAGKAIPCFALAGVYEPKENVERLSGKSLAANLAQSAISKRRSWAPPLTSSNRSKQWSHFVNQSCNHEVRNITFEEDCCVTHCATGNIEKWKLENIDTEPKLVKVAQIEQRQP